MGSDNIFVKRKEERKKRQENVRRQKSSNWLMICEGKQTEPNYFLEAVESVNKNLEKEDQLKVKIIGIGKNTTSLVQSVEHMQYEIDNYKNKMIPYGKIFVVFDKDSFSNDAFDTAIAMCEENGYIPLWSNQAIEYWFLLHFNYIDVKMDRNLYKEKINQYFKEKGARYKYKKNDKKIYTNLCKYGSLKDARRNALKIHSNYKKEKPSESESCTTVYKFFDEIEERLKELE